MRAKVLLLTALVIACPRTSANAWMGEVISVASTAVRAAQAAAAEVTATVHARQERIAQEKDDNSHDQSLTLQERVRRDLDLERSRQKLEKAESAVNEVQARSVDELLVLNETIRALRYPVWAICNSTPWRLPEKDKWNEYLDRLQKELAQLAPNVGMFVQYRVKRDGKLQWLQNGATAFAVGGPYVLTNRHVITSYADKGVDGEWHLLKNQHLTVQFPKEYSKCDSPTATIEATVLKVELVGEGEEDDYAVLKIDQDFSHVPFSDSDQPAEGLEVVAIGYPTKPEPCEGRTPTDLHPCTFLTETEINLLFGTPDKSVPFPAERISPGNVLYNPTSGPDKFSYTASTWGGNSGSPVVSLTDGKIVGLHFQSLNASSENVGYNNAIAIGKLRPVLEAHGYIR